MANARSAFEFRSVRISSRLRDFIKRPFQLGSRLVMRSYKCCSSIRFSRVKEIFFSLSLTVTASTSRLAKRNRRERSWSNPCDYSDSGLSPECFANQRGHIGKLTLKSVQSKELSLMCQSRQTLLACVCRFLSIDQTILFNVCAVGFINLYWTHVWWRRGELKKEYNSMYLLAKNL